ncbi:hypothetical protein V6N12_025422 [Hibiscus sabdariffa]|uniref:Uncharacterized protein n=1 Tax=Hibiscus sabdariffa TaxID=183260 RepID=A0ABR2CIF7_9ROSI
MLLGFSEPTLVDYTIGLAKQAASPADLLSLLCTLEDSALPWKQMTYRILDADDNENDVGTSSGKADKRKKHLRKKFESEQDDDDIRHVDEKRRVKRWSSQDEDDGSESGEERLCDQREREDLERNIRQCDAAATNDINSLRKVSRQEYLKKREQKKLEQLRDGIEDGQYLFDGVNLTKAEYLEFIKASVMDVDKFDNEMSIESPEKSKAKSELEKLQEDRKAFANLSISRRSA